MIKSSKDSSYKEQTISKFLRCKIRSEQVENILLFLFINSILLGYVVNNSEKSNYFVIFLMMM